MLHDLARELLVAAKLVAPPPPPPPPPSMLGLSSSAIFSIVIVTLLLEYALSTISSLLNQSSLASTIPKEFEGVYDAAKYAKSQDYTRAKARFSHVTRTFDLCLLLTFWLLFDGFERLDVWAREVVPEDRPVLQGLAYFGVFGIFVQVMALPFEVYSTFVLEEHFGFNKTTCRTFVMDRIKSLFLTLVLAPFPLGLVIYYFSNSGPYGWFWAWSIITAFQVVLLLIAPILIMPLFLKFTELPQGELRTAIESYAKSVDFKAAGGIFEVDGSTRSSHSNAFFTGFGSTKRIALFDTLIQQSNTSEIIAVLAHEVGHEKKGHVTNRLLTAIVHTFALFWVMSFFLAEPALFSAFSVSHPSVHVGLVLFGLLYEPINVFLEILMTMRSRADEREADRYSVDTNGDAEALVSGLKKLSKNNLDNLTPHPFHVWLTYSHPPVLERIQLIRRRADELKAMAQASKSSMH